MSFKNDHDKETHEQSITGILEKVNQIDTRLGGLSNQQHNMEVIESDVISKLQL